MVSAMSLEKQPVYSRLHEFKVGRCGFGTKLKSKLKKLHVGGDLVKKKKPFSSRQLTNMAHNMLSNPTPEQLEHTKQMIKIENEREITHYLKNNRITSKDDYKLFLEADKLAGHPAKKISDNGSLA